MLKSWSEYNALSQQSGKTPPTLTSLADRANDALWLLPAYAQTEYIYGDGGIINVDEARYHTTPTINRVNQFDAMGPSYNPSITDITIEKRLGEITAAAATIAANEQGIMKPDGRLSSGKLMVIDGLRTVDAAYLLGAANPLALENKLLSLPGTSAHNKGMAVDLITVYFDEEKNAWCDADMLGHIDHPDMITNHRNYLELSEVQQHNRLYLEQLMLRGAFENGILLAPLREEFWDFRFPEDGLDLWRVLESISRAAGIADAFEICLHNIELIRKLYRTSNKETAYAEFELTAQSFAEQCLTLYNSVDARAKLKAVLHTSPEQLAELSPVYHGGMSLVFDSDLPAHLRQANPALAHLLK